MNTREWADEKITLTMNKAEVLTFFRMIRVKSPEWVALKERLEAEFQQTKRESYALLQKAAAEVFPTITWVLLEDNWGIEDKAFEGPLQAWVSPDGLLFEGRNGTGHDTRSTDPVDLMQALKENYVPKQGA